MIINMSNSGSSGKVVIVRVIPKTQASVTCTNNNKTFTSTTDATGNAIFKLTKGIWSITVEKNGFTKTVNINVTEDCTVELSLEQLPKFTYTGNYKIVDDSNTPINSSLGNWKIHFLTSGTLTFTTLNGAENGIDVFLVGGGGGGGKGNRTFGGGGGGGYTTTAKRIMVTLNTPYNIAIGAGGTADASGGSSSAFGATAKGGGNGKGTPQIPENDAGVAASGGNGGSGGGAFKGVSGASDGGSTGTTGGRGQGTTTREFGEPGGKLYSGGGGGGAYNAPPGAGGAGGGATGGKSASNNTGGGGGGCMHPSGPVGSGGSGIIIIRNARG